MNTCPRGNFRRLIFYEEIKYALKYGYTINIEYCYQLKRGVNLFKEYIEDHYQIKASTSDPVQKATAKLFLNYLYGRFGMKEIDNKMEIVTKEQVDILDKNKNISIISELNNNNYLIRHSSKISDNIKKLY